MSSEKTFVAFVAVHRAFSLLLHQALKLRNETLVAFFIVRFVLKYDVIVAIQRNSVIRVRQVLGRPHSWWHTERAPLQIDRTEARS